MQRLKTPVERGEHPAVLQGQIGYEFFTLDKETKIPREFTLTQGDANAARALEVINDLAYHIKATLDAVNQSLGSLQGAAAVPEAGAPPRHSVYLAETSFQVEDERSQVRRDLVFAALTNTPSPRSACRTQRRARFALMPWAIATAALDTPGTLQAATTCALNSALCVRRRRRPALTSLEIVCTCPPKTQWTRAS